MEELLNGSIANLFLWHEVKYPERDWGSLLSNFASSWTVLFTHLWTRVKIKQHMLIPINNITILTTRGNYFVKPWLELFSIFISSLYFAMSQSFFKLFSMPAFFYMLSLLVIMSFKSRHSLMTWTTLGVWSSIPNPQSSILHHKSSIFTPQSLNLNPHCSILDPQS